MTEHDRTLSVTNFEQTITPALPFIVRVEACNFQGACKSVAERSFNAPALKPAVPAAELRPGSTRAPGPVLSGSRVTLRWAAVTRATGYQVELRNETLRRVDFGQSLTPTSVSVSISTSTHYYKKDRY